MNIIFLSLLCYLSYFTLTELFTLTESFNKNPFNKNKFATKIVHTGNEIDESTGNFITPIVLGTTFSQILPGVRPGKDDLNSHGSGYFYSRMGNPTRGALERALAGAENAKHSAVFSSGMAAISTVIQLLKPGDHVVAMDDLYGGTSAYFKTIARETNGIDFTFVSVAGNNLDIIEQSIKKKNKKKTKTKTKLIWLESLTNPLLKTVDIKAVSKIAKKHNCLLVVDSTFTSPYLFNPLMHGADIVIHSATKYIGGHSDIIMGVIACNDDNLIKKIRFIQSGVGAIPSPFECYLTMRGLKTLHLRMKASQSNAKKLAKFLESNSMVEKVIYPGLKSYNYYDLVQKQFNGPGAIISFYIKGDASVVNKFLKSLKIFNLAVSLGAVESLLCAPALMTHASIDKTIRESIGITDNLIRVSVGIEDSNDLIKDIKQALNKASK
jgi:cystathionine gamma-lyase